MDPHLDVEILALAILNELRSRAAIKGRGRFELDVLYARAKAKLWTKVEPTSQAGGICALSDFGTRRRHGFLWQRWCVEAVKEGLGSSFTGTSNVLLAMDNDLEAIGTNAHELPMVAAALAKDDEELRWAPYRILDQWRQTYRRQPPDRTARCLRHQSLPARCAGMGRRLDRLQARQRPADPGRGEEIIAWWEKKGRNPKDKLLVFSDAMDVGSIEETYHHFAGRVRCPSAGAPTSPMISSAARRMASFNLDPISLVCKVSSVDGHPAVKFSGQSGEGDRHALGDRTLPARVRRRRPCASRCWSKRGSNSLHHVKRGRRMRGIRFADTAPVPICRHLKRSAAIRFTAPSPCDAVLPGFQVELSNHPLGFALQAQSAFRWGHR
ncbi:hypothetical protein ACU4GH_20325 [Bradyrhizobium betae]